MNMEEFDYHFKVRSIKDEALNLSAIYKGVAYSKFDKSELAEIYNISNRDVNDINFLQTITNAVADIHNREKDNMDTLCRQLQLKWSTYRKQYLKIISKEFGIVFNKNVINHIYCYLQQLPINEVDLKDNTIYLNCNQSLDEMFTNFIVMLTKIMLLYKWNSFNHWEYNTDFDVKNKIFMFVDIAVDAVFANSELCEISSRPSYRYFYNLNVENQNVMDKFRGLYTQMTLENFFTEVYMFVYINYQTLQQFKHYLY